MPKLRYLKSHIANRKNPHEVLWTDILPDEGSEGDFLCLDADGMLVWKSYDALRNETEVPDPAHIQITHVRLQTGAGYEFSEEDLHIAWDDVQALFPMNIFQRYQIHILDASLVVVGTHYTRVEQFNYRLTNNRRDFGGTPSRDVRVQIYAVDKNGELYAASAVTTFTNPAPSMASYSPTLSVAGLRCTADWKSWTAPEDIIAFHLKFQDGTTPPTTSAGSVSGHTLTKTLATKVQRGHTYYFQVFPVDVFGEGTGSNIVSTAGAAIERLDLAVGAATMRAGKWAKASSGTDILLASHTIAGADSDDAIKVSLTGNGSATYRIKRYQDFSVGAEIIGRYTIPAGCKSSMQALIDLSDGRQPLIVNDYLESSFDVNLYGGGVSDTYTGIAQIFQTTSGMGARELHAVEFFVSYNGSPTIYTVTAYLYDSNGSTVGSNLLATSNSYSDDKNPVSFGGGSNWMGFVFPTPYSLAASTYYALVVTRSARSTSNYWNFYEGPDYSGGLALRRSNNAWASASVHDFAFKLFTTQSSGDWHINAYGTSDVAFDSVLDLVVLRR